MSNQDINFSLEAFYKGASSRIRYVMHDGEPWYSVVDVVGLLTDAPTPRMYWADMKRKIHNEGFRELLIKCRPLKVVALDGKLRDTDCANFATIVTLIHAIPALRRRERNGHELSDIASPISGIYAIVNTRTNEQYIGSSHDIAARFRQHRGLLRRGKHHAQRLQYAWNTYGEAAFELVVLEDLTTSSQLAEREQWYLDTVMPVYNGANVAQNQSVLTPISPERLQHVLLRLYDIQSMTTAAPLFRQLREAIICGVIVPGPNFQRLLEAEANNIETWTAFDSFLQQQAS